MFRLCYGSGWVHRDISTISAGDVYLYEGCGVLGDLEFAKRTDDGSYLLHFVYGLCLPLEDNAIVPTMAILLWSTHMAISIINGITFLIRQFWE